MALLDFLKRKKEVEKAKKAEKNSPVSGEKVSAVKKEDKEPVRSDKKTSKTDSAIVRGPHVSEKATIAAEKNQYTFKVHAGSNKPEIAKEIEKTYKVDVLAVKVIKIPKKKRRLGRVEGWRKGYRKAVVTIKEGQKIEVF